MLILFFIKHKLTILNNLRETEGPIKSERDSQEKGKQVSICTGKVGGVYLISFNVFLVLFRLTLCLISLAVSTRMYSQRFVQNNKIILFTNLRWFFF